MRLIGAIAIVFAFALTLAVSGAAPPIDGDDVSGASSRDGERIVNPGRAIFRFDTFGDEQLWTDVLRMHEAVASVDPTTALTVGLKVDVDALPRTLIAALRKGEVDLTDPAVTIELLRLNAVVGLRGKVNASGQLTSLGVTCALCHSTVDNSLAGGIGRRLDGWANTDLNVGAIVALSPVLDDATKAEFRAWGPGKYDPRHHAFDGTTIIPLNSPSLPVVIPPIYGLRGVGFETYTGDGPISYWNSYVGVSQMGGQGRFFDPRLPLRIIQTPDLVTPKLLPLLVYQLSLDAPEPPKGSFDGRSARRGLRLFRARRNARAVIRARPSLTSWMDRGTDCRCCTIRRRWGWTRVMPGEAPRASIGRRRCVPSGSMRRTSMTGAQPTSVRSSLTTTGSSVST